MGLWSDDPATNWAGIGGVAAVLALIPITTSWRSARKQRRLDRSAVRQQFDAATGTLAVVNGSGSVVRDVRTYHYYASQERRNVEEARASVSNYNHVDQIMPGDKWRVPMPGSPRIVKQFLESVDPGRAYMRRSPDPHRVILGVRFKDCDDRLWYCEDGQARRLRRWRFARRTRA